VWHAMLPEMSNLASVDTDEMTALGLYDPARGDPPTRRELVELLVECGATAGDLVAWRDMLPALAGVLAFRGERAMTLGEAAERSGLGVDRLRFLLRVAGLPEPEPDARVITEGFVEFASRAEQVAAVFGEEAVPQILRVFGAAVARVADALISTFLVHVEPAARRRDPSGLEVARANIEAGRLLPMVAPVVDALLRQHLMAAQRSAAEDADLVGYETQNLLVGFVDLVGSTELGEQLEFRGLGEILTVFEQLAFDIVTGAGGRLVKLIGDEVLFTTADPGSGVGIALDLASALDDHPAVPPARAGLAYGRVMMRDGDVFGPVVNLASRVVDEAGAAEVLATAEVAELAGCSSEPAGRRRVRGVEEAVELRRILGR
jgi:adenylate cyclase